MLRSEFLGLGGKTDKTTFSPISPRPSIKLIIALSSIEFRKRIPSNYVHWENLIVKF